MDQDFSRVPALGLPPSPHSYQLLLKDLSTFLNVPHLGSGELGMLPEAHMTVAENTARCRLALWDLRQVDKEFKVSLSLGREGLREEPLPVALPFHSSL